MKSHVQRMVWVLSGANNREAASGLDSDIEQLAEAILDAETDPAEPNTPQEIQKAKSVLANARVARMPRGDLYHSLTCFIVHTRFPDAPFIQTSIADVPARMRPCKFCGGV
jgi:hypothetical protein